jgi:hypothetical protein
MKQILHIFQKDARHLWREILLSFALTAAFAMIYPRQWSPYNYGHGTVAGGFSLATEPGLALMASLLVLLVPIGWWILITRVVQSESLVGDGQFWITRPYEWKKLLAAKALFLVVFLYLPIFIAHCVLLKTAGFHPLSYLPGLLFNLLLITFILVLPGVSLATVTSSFARMTLTLLALIFGIIFMSSLPSMFDAYNAPTPYGDTISPTLAVCICGAVVVIQYAARRVWLSRFLLLSVPVLTGIVSLATPEATLMQRAYPRPTSSQSLPLQIALDTELMDQATARPARSSKLVSLNIPLKVSGIEDGRAYQSDDVWLSIEGQNGLHWTSMWRAYGWKYLPGTQSSWVGVDVSRAFYDQVKSSPVTLHLTFALTELRAGQATVIPLPAGKFPVPGVGICSPDITWDGLHITGISCLSAVREPRLSYVNVLWSSAKCSGTPTAPETAVQGAGWIGTLDNAPASFGITSVWRNPLNLSNNSIGNRDYTPENRHLCPGMPVTFTQYKMAGRTQTDLTIPNFRLPDYAISAPTKPAT